MRDVPILDEIVLMDSNSTDRTREIAADLGVPVHIHQEVLSKYGSRKGKGEALWKSLYCTRGDIIIWIDTDIVNIGPHFVYGLIGPLLLKPELKFVKGFYRRPLKVGNKMQAGSGGRVTELTARPLINLFYPELSGIVQPLSGEYGGRRSALETTSLLLRLRRRDRLLIDMLDKFGLAPSVRWTCRSASTTTSRWNRSAKCPLPSSRRSSANWKATLRAEHSGKREHDHETHPLWTGTFLPRRGGDRRGRTSADDRNTWNISKNAAKTINHQTFELY
jgi:hypothetical protein